MFQTLIYPSSGACDYSVELPHWSYCSWFDVCWRFGVVGLEWYPCCRLKHNTDTTPNQPHRNSNTHQTKNNMTNVVIQKNSRKLLMMDILMSETCWAHKKWNKTASDIKLVFYSSTITMMHSPINIGWKKYISSSVFYSLQLTSARSCKYSCTSSWRWVSTPETCRAVYRYLINWIQSHLVGQIFDLIHNARTHEYKTHVIFLMKI